MADFIDIFGEDFSSVLASLDELPPEVETMLLGVMDKMVYDVRTFSNSLEKTVFSMNQAGVSDDIIKQTLANDMGTGGRIFGELRNNTKASIVDGINQSAKMGQYKNYDLDKGEFVWVAVGGHKVCMDCDGRAGQQMTFAEWEREGLPGSGWSVCQGYCYCVLDPTGKASKKIDAPVREKGAKKVLDPTNMKMAGKHKDIKGSEAWLKKNVGVQNIKLNGIDLAGRNRLNALFKKHLDDGYTFTYNTIDSYHSKSGVVARSSTTNLRLNRYHLGPKALEKFEKITAKRCVRTGHWADGGLSFESIMSHEMGHGLSLNDLRQFGDGTKMGSSLRRLHGEYKSQMLKYMREFKKDWVASGKTLDEFSDYRNSFITYVDEQRIVNGVTRNFRQGTNNMSKFYKEVYKGEYISDYGATNIYEWVAESFMTATHSTSPSSWAVKVKEIMLEGNQEMIAELIRSRSVRG